MLGASSGFQSLQYRELEFLLGNKNADMLKVFAHDAAAHARLARALAEPSLYDEFLRYLARRGHAVPQGAARARLSRGRTSALPSLLPVFKRIYENAKEFWPEYHLCEQLVDIEESFQLWRFRHMKTVERIIGFKRGTGGSSGVAFLQEGAGADVLSGADRRAEPKSARTVCAAAQHRCRLTRPRSAAK